MSDEAMRARAEARRSRMWIRRVRLDAPEPAEDGTPEERFALAVQLSLAAWEMTGRPLPAPGTARTVARFVPRSAG